jgi:hypothetical protein
MSVAATRSEIEFTPDVQQLAARLGVAAELPKVLEMTQDVFPDAAVEVAVEEDPEIADEVCLAIVVRTNVADGRELFQMARPWHRRIFECCRPDQASAFRLDTSWRS